MFPRLRSFLTTLTQRERFEDSLDEEVRFHLDAQTEDLARTGVPPAEAARRARVQFGSIEAMKDDCRRARGLRITDELAQSMANIRRCTQPPRWLSAFGVVPRTVLGAISTRIMKPRRRARPTGGTGEPTPSVGNGEPPTSSNHAEFIGHRAA